MLYDTSPNPFTPDDYHGHGTQVAGIATGNALSATIYGAQQAAKPVPFQGVAPHANLIIYSACDQACSGAALLGAVDQVVLDHASIPGGIDVLNFPVSYFGDPWSSPILVALLNVVTVGIYVAAPAGNVGPESFRRI